ncbi:hypothetical protein CLAFUR0_03733 [Fulvia fulva]|nr:hypothetical protein CLAFUR0_03733 [Fulvia fulva]
MSSAMGSLLHHFVRDVKTDANAFPAGMDMDRIQNERTLAYGVLAMLVAIWFILAAVVTFLGGRDEDTTGAPGVALKDMSSSEATTQSSSQTLMMRANGVETRDMERGKGRA